MIAYALNIVMSIAKIRNMILEGRIGSAIMLQEVPMPYKKYKLIGRGTTSLVYEHPTDPEKVIMLSKDPMKIEWLAQPWSKQNIAKIITTIKPARPHPNSYLREYDIDVLEMPRLYPVSRKDVTMMMDIIKGLLKLDRSRGLDAEELMKTAKTPIEKEIMQQFCDLADFLANYDQRQYVMDLHSKNIMITKEGKYVIVDPIIERNMLDYVRAMRRY